jgi:hypothetical protein
MTTAKNYTWGNDKQLRADAEEIFQGYEAEEFEINAKAKRMDGEIEILDKTNTGRIARSERLEGSLASVFATTLSRYQVMRGSKDNWTGAAHDLIFVHKYVRAKGGLKVGAATKRKMEAKDKQIRALRAEVQTWRGKAALFEKRFLDCNDARITREHVLEGKKRELDVIRWGDMKNSLQSKTAESKAEAFEEEKKGGQKK